MSRAKKTRLKATALDRVAARLRMALRRETKNIVEIGNILIEIRDKYLDHGEWQSWLAENFDLPYRTAIRYVNAAEYVKDKSATVALGNLSPSVLYGLTAGHYNEQEEAAILTATGKGRVDQDAAGAICNALEPPEPEEPDQPDDGDDGGETEAEDPEITAIFDNPPDVQPTENLPPTNFALRDFDQAIAVLQRLMTKSSAQYVNTTHSSSDLENVEGFIHAVADKVRKARKESRGEEVDFLPGPASRVP